MLTDEQMADEISKRNKALEQITKYMIHHQIVLKSDPLSVAALTAIAEKADVYRAMLILLDSAKLDDNVATVLLFERWCYFTDETIAYCKAMAGPAHVNVWRLAGWLS